MYTYGCMLGPNFEPPKPPTPQEYREPHPAGESIVNVPWWEVYQDKQLINLINTALENNKDLLLVLSLLNLRHEEIN